MLLGLPAGYQYIRVPACYRLLRDCDSSMFPERNARGSTHRLPVPNESCRLPASPVITLVLSSPSNTTLRLSYGPVAVSGTDSCRYLSSGSFFSFPSWKGDRFLPAGHQTALVPTRYRLTSPPALILRVIVFLFVTRTVLVILPAGYYRYWYLSVTDFSRYVLKSGNFRSIPWSARVITRRLHAAAGPSGLPVSPGILGLGIPVHFPEG
jgi:hypothetical protein